MSRIALLAAAGVILMVSGQADGQNTPEAVAARAVGALRRGDWDMLLKNAHPEALGRAKADICLMYSFGEPPERLLDIFGVFSVEEMRALPAESLLVRFMTERAKRDSRSLAAPRIIGHVVDGDSVAYVIVVTDPRPQPFARQPEDDPLGDSSAWTREQWVDVMTVKRDREGTWRTMLDGGLFWTRSLGNSGP